MSDSFQPHDSESPVTSAPGSLVSDSSSDKSYSSETVAMNQANADLEKTRVPKAWKTACLVFGLGFIFASGMLLGERLKTTPPPSSESGLIGDNSNPKGATKNPVAALPSAIADIAAEAAPSVVTIELLPLKPSDKNSGIPNPLSFFPGMNGPNTSGNNESTEGLAPPPRRSLGTGIIMRPDGYIITSGHVIRPGTSIMVGLNDKRRLPAEIVGRDMFSDLAVLRVNAKDLPAAKFGTIKNLRPGDWAIAIGSPLGFDHTVTLGIISAIGRSIDDETFHNRVDLIQTDAAINFGNSGGPLLNIKGEVIGINTAIRGDAQNISFAIPVDEARKVALQLIEHGEIPRPYLGIYMADMNPNIAQQIKAPADLNGVLVTKVVAGGPCDKGGLGAGDVLQKVDGKPVLLASDVRKITREKKPGDEFDVEFWRKGALQNRKLVVGKYPTGSFAR